MGSMGTPTAAQRHRGAFIAGLRELADLLERYDDLPVPSPSLGGEFSHVRARIHGDDAANRFAAATRRLGAVPEVSAGAIQTQHRLGSPHDRTLGLVYGVLASPSEIAGAPTVDEITRRARAFVAGVTGVSA